MVVVAPLNWRLAAPELTAVINDSGAKVLFVGPEFNAVIRQIAPDLTTMTETVAWYVPGVGDFIAQTAGLLGRLLRWASLWSRYSSIWSSLAAWAGARQVRA